MRKSFKTDFSFGDEVYIRTMPETKCVVTGFLVREKGITVGVQRGENEEWFEMCALVSAKKPFKVKGFYDKVK